ncbi:hypothetical protein ACFPN9_26440, partial [Bosea massiliensis]
SHRQPASRGRLTSPTKAGTRWLCEATPPAGTRPPPMPTHRSSRTFADRIAAFCRKRLLSSLGPDTDRLEAYLLDLIARHEWPPLHSTGYSWREIAANTGIAYPNLVAIKEEIRPALDAMVRAYDAETGEGFVPSKRADPGPKSANHAFSVRSRRSKATAPASTPSAQATVRPAISSAPGGRGSKRGAKSGQVHEYPQPKTLQWPDPPTFREALALQLERHGDSYWHLHRAVVREGETFDRQTLRSWVQGTRAPISVASMEILRRIERRYQLPVGYFEAKLPHRARAVRGHEPQAIGRAERRRLAWHLPENFNALPRAERDRIVEWVRRVILSGATDYRRYQAAAAKHRYAIRFPGVAYGRSEPAHGLDRGHAPEEGMPQTDPDLISGVVDVFRRASLGLTQFRCRLGLF